MLGRVVVCLFFLFTSSFGQEMSWLQMNNGPYADQVTSLIVNITGSLYASTTFGVYRTTDGGTIWKHVNTTRLIDHLAADASGRIFAAARWPSALFCSSDDGQSWERINHPIPYYSPTALTTTLNGDVYIGFRDGMVFRSSDHGGSWTTVSIGNVGNIHTLATNSRNHVFAGCTLGIYRSTNAGLEWEPAHSGLPVQTDYVVTIAIERRADFLYAGFDSGKVFTSSDNGESWNTAQPGLPPVRLFSLAAADSTTVYVASSNGIYRSTSNGNHWQEHNSGLSNTFTPTIVFAEAGRIYTGVPLHGVFTSRETEPWHHPETGVSNTIVQTIEAHGRTAVFAGSFGGLYRSTNSGESWEDVSPIRDSTIVTAVKSLTGARIIAGTDDGKLYLSTDSGSSWTVEGNGLPRSMFRTFAVGPSDMLYAALESYGIFRSSDFGHTWERLGTSGLYPWVMAIVIDETGNIFAGTWQGIYRSTDNGTTWVKKDSSITYPSLYSLASDQSGTLVAGTTSSGIYRSTDNGENWVPAGSGGRSVYRLAYANGLFVAATMDSGFFFSATKGTTWQRISAGLDAGEPRALAIDSVGYLWIGLSAFAGVYRTQQPFPMFFENGFGRLPRVYALSQNHPNPFNPTTMIEFDLPRRSDVSIVVFDVLGRQVERLVNDVRDAGRHSISFDASKVSSGVYFYRLIADGLVQTKKMIVQK